VVSSQHRIVRRRLVADPDSGRRRAGVLESVRDNDPHQLASVGDLAAGEEREVKILSSERKRGDSAGHREHARHGERPGAVKRAEVAAGDRGLDRVGIGRVRHRMLVGVPGAAGDLGRPSYPVRDAGFAGDRAAHRDSSDSTETIRLRARVTLYSLPGSGRA
jgi:hypothetical protein